MQHVKIINLLKLFLCGGFKDGLFLTFTPTGWRFQISCLLSSLFNEIIQFDEHIFQVGLVQPSTSLLGERLTAI